MTKEEILEMLEEMRQNTINADDYNDPQRDRKRIALDVAIKALEQQPCGDAISRKEALEALEQEEPLVWCDGADEIAAHNQWSSDFDTIKNMPPVQLKPKTGHWIQESEAEDESND